MHKLIDFRLNNCHLWFATARTRKGNKLMCMYTLMSNKRELGNFQYSSQHTTYMYMHNMSAVRQNDVIQEILEEKALTVDGRLWV